MQIKISNCLLIFIVQYNFKGNSATWRVRMAEPLSGTATVATVTTVSGWSLFLSTLIGLVTSADYSIVFGSFCGALFFVISARDMTKKQAVAFFIISYGAGVLGASFLADMIEARLDYTENPLDGLAALLISSLAVYVLLWLRNGGLFKLPLVKKWSGEE